MGLKAFHVVFVTASILLALGSGIYGVAAWSREAGAGWLALGIGGFTAAAALVWYGLWFLRKLKDVNAS